MAQMGTLTRNTADHPKRSTRKPPARGPTAMPMPDTPAHTPIARPRSRGSTKVLVRMESVVGKMKAPPTPISARAAITMAGLEAVEATAENVPNHSRPKVSAPLLPYRSPSEPAVRSRQANTMVYASTIH